ncbi:hypothetical protein EJB05_36010, partial [Eragrostis curvula]
MERSLLSLIIALLCSIVRQLGAINKWPWWQTTTLTAWDWESALRFLGIRLGDVPTTVIRDRAVTVDALVRRADVFSDRPLGGGATTIISDGRLQIITTVPYGPHWVALRRNLTSEAFHPVRGLARAVPHRARAVSALVADIAARSADGGGGGVVPVRECLYAALFALNVATCFGDGVDGEQVEAMRVAQREFLRILPSFRVFSTFQKVARLLYRGRWKQLVHSRRTQEEMYLPLVKACQERRRRTGDTTTATSYVDTLLDLEVPMEGDPPHRRRKLNDGEMVGLGVGVPGRLDGHRALPARVDAGQPGAAAGRPEPAARRGRGGRRRGLRVPAGRGDGVAAAAPASAVGAAAHEQRRRGRWHARRRGHVVNFSLEDIGWDGKIWTSPEQFIPDRFMPGGEGAGVRLTVGSKETTKVKMMPFGAGRRICPGMGYATLNFEYFLANLVKTFEWHPVKGEEVDLTAEHGFFTTMRNPLRARVVSRKTTLATT